MKIDQFLGEYNRAGSWPGRPSKKTKASLDHPLITITEADAGIAHGRLHKHDLPGEALASWYILDEDTRRMIVEACRETALRAVNFNDLWDQGAEAWYGEIERNHAQNGINAGPAYLRITESWQLLQAGHDRAQHMLVCANKRVRTKMSRAYCRILAERILELDEQGKYPLERPVPATAPTATQEPARKPGRVLHFTLADVAAAHGRAASAQNRAHRHWGALDAAEQAEVAASCRNALTLTLNTQSLLQAAMYRPPGHDSPVRDTGDARPGLTAGLRLAVATEPDDAGEYEIYNPRNCNMSGSGAWGEWVRLAEMILELPK